MKEYLVECIIDRLNECPDEELLDLILKILIECGY